MGKFFWHGVLKLACASVILQKNNADALKTRLTHFRWRFGCGARGFAIFCKQQLRISPKNVAGQTKLRVNLKTCQVELSRLSDKYVKAMPPLIAKFNRLWILVWHWVSAGKGETAHYTHQLWMIQKRFIKERVGTIVILDCGAVFIFNCLLFYGNHFVCHHPKLGKCQRREHSWQNSIRLTLHRVL